MTAPNLEKIRDAWANASWEERGEVLAREAFPWVLGTVAAVGGEYLLELSPSPLAAAALSNFQPRLFDSRRHAMGFANDWMENYVGLGVEVEFLRKRKYGVEAPTPAVS